MGGSKDYCERKFVSLPNHTASKVPVDENHRTTIAEQIKSWKLDCKVVV